jgi:integrase
MSSAPIVSKVWSFCNLVQRWLGHASMNTTAIYLQAIGDEEREIAARMWTRADRNQNTSKNSFG